MVFFSLRKREKGYLEGSCLTSQNFMVGSFIEVREQDDAKVRGCGGGGFAGVRLRQH